VRTLTNLAATISGPTSLALLGTTNFLFDVGRYDYNPVTFYGIFRFASPQPGIENWSGIMDIHINGASIGGALVVGNGTGYITHTVTTVHTSSTSCTWSIRFVCSSSSEGECFLTLTNLLYATPSLVTVRVCANYPNQYVAV
jgi:hypothetical protein